MMHDLVYELGRRVVEEGIRMWIEYYRKHSVLTVIITLIVLALSSTAIVAAYQYGEEQRRQAEQQRLANLDLNEQLEELDRVEDSLNSFLIFVEDQRKKVALEQEVIQQLEEERAQLEPIVKTDKEVVEAILELQEERTHRERWKDIIIGFIGGFISEMIVGILLAPWLVPIINKLRARRESPLSGGQASNPPPEE